MSINLILWLYIQLYIFATALGTCFFNKDIQGYYLTQSSLSRGSAVDYLEVLILPDSIPAWGRCHRRFGDNVILYHTIGGEECMRCFYIAVRSPHVLEVHTEGLERCYTDEGAAFTKCPTTHSEAATQMMLYKTRNLLGLKSSPVYCPVEGKFLATYDVNDGTEAAMECPTPYSLLSNCPKGNEISLAFRRCTFTDFEIKFECLGFWNNSRSENFLALRDANNGRRGRGASGRPAPKFRCALIEKEASSGRIRMAFSSDSTCFNNLRSAQDGFELLVLEPLSQRPLPPIVSENMCEFPRWSQGEWEQLEVNGNVMIFTDPQQYKSYAVYCIGSPQASFYPVYARNQCGEEKFSCVALHQRSANVLEFQLSEMEKSLYASWLCEKVESFMAAPRWITQGRVDRYEESPCPVAGEYSGTLPDETTLCAKLYSDCNNLEIMFYTVYSCVNKSRIYEEREYRCLGQWMDADVTYTYTERRDVAGHECFAGIVVSADEIVIAEAGNNCERGIQPLSNGMRLLKQATCVFWARQSDLDSKLDSTKRRISDPSLEWTPRADDTFTSQALSAFTPCSNLLNYFFFCILIKYFI